MQVKLERLRIEEISAVGAAYGSGPANELDGWLVTKQRNPATDRDHYGEAQRVNLANDIKAQIMNLQWLLEMIESGSVDADPTSKARIIKQRDELVWKHRHEMRDGATGRYRPVTDGEFLTDEHGVKHTLNGMHPDLKAVLTPQPRFKEPRARRSE